MEVDEVVLVVEVVAVEVEVDAVGSVVGVVVEVVVSEDEEVVVASEGAVVEEDRKESDGVSFQRGMNRCTLFRFFTSRCFCTVIFLFETT